MSMLIAILGVFLLVPEHLLALETEKLFLSGTGFGDTRDWDFSIDRGHGSGGWSTIAVPSQWELQGFGAYSYGRNDDPAFEVGTYRYRFKPPDSWQVRRVRLVFEGVMTDTEVKLNDEPVGPPHRGGFTRFAYDVTDHLLYGRENLLEVKVAERSDDSSVNAAEREADYWVFGGIYRPVYLEASPPESIGHVAIDARHDGRLSIQVEVAVENEAALVVAHVRDDEGTLVGMPIRAAVTPGVGRVELATTIPEVRAWSAERPHLYFVELKLVRGEIDLHQVRRRFGFRTIEMRPGEGLFVNEKRVLLKGLNRHSFWPTSGRTLNREINRRDVELLKEVNANAVRASHYPPDIEFLEACDELGLYVIDELPGWHDAYDTDIGREILRELVRRDVNHPSLILWANGNEGGWNTSLDADFALHDPQERPVIHPHGVFAGIDADHYPTWRKLAGSLDDESLWNRLRSLWAPLPLRLPTEMLHGLYDGGLGAGLEDFWRLIRDSQRAVGGFLWAFLDEGVERVDRGGEIDTHGNHAPDGLVGPYREKEGSFYAVRELWSPVIVATDLHEPFGGELELENRFDETDFAECQFDWQWLRFPGPAEVRDAEILLSSGSAGPNAPPGSRGVLEVGLPPPEADALRLMAFDVSGRLVSTRVFPRRARAQLVHRWLFSGDRDSDGALEGKDSPTREHPEEAPDSSGGSPSGWSLLDRMMASETAPGGTYGIELKNPLPRVDQIKTIEWLGGGPMPVWANRLAGPVIGRWVRNVSGDERPGGDWRGFYKDVYWMKIIGSKRTVTVVPESDALYVSVSAPVFPEDSRHASAEGAEVPSRANLSFLRSIPAIGTKFHPAHLLGPQSRTSEPTALPQIKVWVRVEPTLSD